MSEQWLTDDWDEDGGAEDDLGDIFFDEVVKDDSFELRDPLIDPWGDTDRMTRSQRICHHILKTTESPLLGIVGAAGSGKSYFCACAAVLTCQEFPGSKGMVVSNTFPQLKDNAIPHLTAALNRAGLEFSFHERRTIDGQPYTNLYVVHLPNGEKSYILLRAFTNIERIEGVELDWTWFEEIQQTDKDNFVTAVRRTVRGQVGDNRMFIAGMPSDEFHWMYSLLPEMGFIEENDLEFNDDEDLPVLEEGQRGILLEPAVYENLDNLPEGILETLRASHDKQQVKRYLDGDRTSLNSNKVFYSYSHKRHRYSAMHEHISGYDPQRRVIICVDFNITPMSATAWQIKPWNDSWANGDLNDPPNRDIAVQINEWEVWSGGTEGLMDGLIDEYKYHKTGLVVTGDATGNAQTPNASVSNWGIIRRRLAKSSIPSVSLIPGLIQNSDIRKGTVKYSNPEVEETINLGNRLLLDANNNTHVIFKQNTKLESGGLAKAVAFMDRKPDGSIDESNDRSDDRTLPRTHLVDTFRYFCWWWKGNKMMSSEDFDNAVNQMVKDADINSSTFSDDTGGFDDAVF